MSDQQAVGIGGWSPFGPLTPEAAKVFATATDNGVVGRVTYMPESVATQLVAGMNYDFKCKATPSSGDAPILWQAKVFIFAPLKGQPHVTKITPAQ